MNNIDIWKECIKKARSHGWKHCGSDVGDVAELFVDGDLIRFYVKKHKCWVVENIYDLLFNDRSTFSECLFGTSFRNDLCAMINLRKHPTDYLAEWIKK